MGKPLCPTCRIEMSLARVEVRAANPPDYSTFRCPTCNYTETSLTFGSDVLNISNKLPQPHAKGLKLRLRRLRMIP
jgi:transposase-like protein